MKIKTTFFRNALLLAFGLISTLGFGQGQTGVSVDKIVSYQPLNLDPGSWEELFKRIHNADDIKN